jgi:hypothetical protein
MAVDDKNKILLRDLEDMLWYKNYQRYHLWNIGDPHHGIKKDILKKRL